MRAVPPAGGAGLPAHLRAKRVLRARLAGALRWACDSAYCVDVPGGGSADGRQLLLFRPHGGPNQTFRPRR